MPITNQHKQICFLVSIILFSLVGACTTSSEKEKQKLLAINNDQRKAHMTNDADLLVASMSDSLITVDAGNISTSSKSEILNRFSTYFNSVKYLKWDDLQTPLIQLSQAHDHATVSVRKEVILKSKSGITDTTVFAWTSAYQKIKGEWKMYSITSTDNH